MARSLVTGGAGFIGSHLCEALAARGDEVVCLDNFDPFYDPAVKRRHLRALLGHPRFRLVEGDIRDLPLIGRLFAERRFDRVYHLAAKAGVRPSLLEPLLYEEVNVRGTLHLLEACRQRGVGHFLFASSSSVYGEQQEHPFREDLDADHPVSPYGATKRAAELLGYAYHRLYGIPFTSLRFFTVYGPRQRPEMAIHQFTRLIHEGKPVSLYGDGSSKRDYTYIEDILDGVLKASDRPDGYRIYNLGESRTVGLMDLVRLLEGALGKRAEIRYLPAQPGDVPVTYADLGRAKAELGYAPKVSIEEGIARFIAWYRKNSQEVLHPSLPSPRRGEGLG